MLFTKSSAFSTSVLYKSLVIIGIQPSSDVRSEQVHTCMFSGWRILAICVLHTWREVENENNPSGNLAHRLSR